MHVNPSDDTANLSRTKTTEGAASLVRLLVLFMASPQAILIVLSSLLLRLSAYLFLRWVNPTI